MIIKKVVLKDFFRYYGSQEIDCTVENAKNVVVIIGENGRGKTTLLSAFNWVFYDEMLKPLTLENLLNHKKKKELKVGEQAEVSVSIIFEEDSCEYKITRKIYFIKDLKGNVKLLSKKSEENIWMIEKNGDLKVLNYRIESDKLLIPKDLRGFFFFDGERINRLAKVDGKKEIKNAILNVLGISDLDNTKNHLSLIKKGYMTSMKEYTKDSEKENNLLLDITTVSNEIENIKKEINEYNLKMEENDKTIEKLAITIRDYSEENIKALEQSNIKLKKMVDECSNKLIEIEKKIKKHITLNFKYYLMYKYVDDVEQLLESKRKEGRLPSIIKDTFIDDLIERGVCICGTCIKEGTTEYSNVLKMKEQAGSKVLDDAYYNLKNLINIIREHHRTFYKDLNSQLNARDLLKNNIFEYNEEINIITEKLSNSDYEEIKNASRIRETCNKDKIEIAKQLGLLEGELINKQAFLENLEKALSQTKSIKKTVEHYKRKIEITEQLIKLNNEFRDMFIEIVRKELDKRIKEVYASITNKEYRKPVLTDKFELKVLSELKNYEDEYTASEEVLSTGEGQITSLSFIGALVSYARDTKDNDILSRLYGEEYPIVMDSPFGNLDEVHTRNIAANIGKLASQIIIVVSRKQWEGYVEENISNQVIRRYSIVDGEDIHSDGEYSKIMKGE